MAAEPRLGSGEGPLRPIRDQQLGELLQEFRATNPFASHRTPSDPHRAAGRLGEASTSDFHFGVVVDSFPYLHCYKVQFGVGGHRICVAGHQGATGPIGGRELATYPRGTRVLVHKPKKTPIGYIIHAYPLELTNSNFNFPGHILQGGNAGLFAEDAYQHVLKSMYREGGMRDFNNGRPLDGTSFDRGTIYETGLAFLHNLFNFQLRVNEMTGLFGDYLEDRLRLSGENLDIWSAAKTERHRNDEGELSVVAESYLSQAESLGLYAPDAEHVEEVVKPLDAVVNAVRAHYDLADEQQDRQAFGRFQTAEGYLPQGFRRAVVTTRKTTGRRRYRDETTDDVGLYQEHIGPDGAYYSHTAKRHLIVKALGVPVIKQLKEFNDVDGDDAAKANYKFGGETEAGDPHLFASPNFGEADDEEHHLRRGQNALDVVAAYANWLAGGAFVYHEKDWKVQESSEAPDETGVMQEWTDFSVLKNRSWLGPPEPVPVRIGLRRMERYYKRLSYLLFDDDGAFRIKDGYHNAIEGTPHGLILSSPAGVSFVSGGRFVVKAGGDVHLHAQNSIDVVSSTGDIRHKAQRNFHVLAGNSPDGKGIGSIMLECLSNVRKQQFADRVGEEVVSGGIIFKAPKADILTLAAGVYTRTGGGDLDAGPIVFDADQGRQSIMGYGANINWWTRDGLNVWVGPRGEDGTVSKAHSLGNSVILDGNCVLRGAGIVARGMTVGGAVVASGNIAAGGRMADSAGGLIGKAVGLAGDVQVAVQEASEVVEALVGFGMEAHDLSLVQRWYGEELPGNADVIKTIRFTFRDDPDGLQYGVVDFRFPEVPFQQIARLGGADGAVKWTENHVLVAGQKYYPYPGRESWEGETLDAADPVLFSVSGGRALDRENAKSDYEAGTVGELTPLVMKDKFTVTMEPRNV